MVFQVPTKQPDEEDEDYPEDAIRQNFEDSEDFREYLDSFYHSNLSGKDLHILPGVTSNSRDDLVSYLSMASGDWKIEENFGAVKKLSTSDGSSGAYLAMDEDEDGLFILYTDDPKTKEVDENLVKDLNRVPNTRRLHVPSWQIHKLVDSLSSQNERVVVNEVIMKRPMGSQVSSNRDQDTKRTISYWGNDGADAMRDLRDEFGVLISSLRIKVGDELSFKIDKNGVLKLERGIVTNLFEQVESLIQQTLDVKRTYDSTETTEIELAGSEIMVSQSTPALIRPGSADTFDREDIDTLFEYLPELGYLPVDSYIEEEPLYYSSAIYYRQDRLYFDIRGDRNAIRIFPRNGEEELETFFEVLQVVQEQVDSEATTEIVDGGN